MFEQCFIISISRYNIILVRIFIICNFYIFAICIGNILWDKKTAYVKNSCTVFIHIFYKAYNL